MNYFAHPTAVIDEGANVGEGSRVWHFAHLMPDCSVGEHCVIGQNVFIASHVTLGNNVHVQNNVSIYEGVVCEDDVFLGPSMVFTNIKNPRSAVPRKGQYLTTTVRRGATIGANATVVCGVEIGAYSLVGAGAVVTRDILPFALVMGTPARQEGWVSRYGHRLSFNNDDLASCPESGEQYSLKEGKVTLLV